MIFGLYKKFKRKRLREEPFPVEWREILEEAVPLYSKLPANDKRELEGSVLIFLEEKSFEGAKGLEITDEIRLSIAAQACLLTLHRKTNYFPTLNHIVVYPHTYVAQSTEILPGGVVAEGEQIRSGESWSFGTIVLSWDDVLKGTRNIYDGHNVILHEFAHQLDLESGSTNGAPLLGAQERYASWARVLSSEYEKMRKSWRYRKRSVLDSYAASNPAEFFAVATEAFFEKPKQLKKKHPDLYEELRTYFKQDPANL